ncbi:MAG: class I SAM-dependent methyltransferase [Polyangiaceae bacterium]|nr:class I SAM-dependent methyltransferase [Polyangiaceae bacterium]MCB9607704.1 class I SAM-dependent methyltransferase [Polyangiaceae bacterium]
MKQLIGWSTRYVPRHHLHRLSHLFLTLISPLYRGDEVEDPISGKSYRKFLPYGRLQTRENALSLSLSLERHRLMWLYLKLRTDFFSKRARVLHIAPEYCFIRPFRAMKNLDYVTADLNSPWADVHMDAHEMPFADDSFDVIFCNHVLEHVADDKKVLAELFRVMRPGGWGLFQVPIDTNLERSHGDPSITNPRERERLYGQSDHVRQYGLDFEEIVRSVGFDVEVDALVNELPPEDVQRYALPAGEMLYIARKPAEKQSTATSN